MKFDVSDFWDKKILKWEADKYSQKSTFLVNFDINSSLKSRMDLARSILRKVAPGRTILELGCGSGQLAEQCILFGAERYVGIDISNVAIQSAKERVQNSVSSSKIEFKTGSITEISQMQADICFSLGLVDWLDQNEIELLRTNVKCNFYFHTFSEKRSFSASQLLHRLYVFLKYGYKNMRYVPKYYSACEIKKILTLDNSPDLQFLRRPELSFGCVAHNLPPEIEGLP